jgi:hypothetical protein
MFKHVPSSFAWMAAFFAALGTLFFILGAHTFYRNWQFASNAERVKGIVTDRHISVSHGRHGSSTTYHIGFRYADHEGAEFVTSVSVVSDTYDSLHLHRAVPVKYLAQYHSINRIDLPEEDSSYQTQAMAFTGFGLLFGGCGWYSFISLERLIFYRRWLRKNGVQCRGRVRHGQQAQRPLPRVQLYRHRRGQARGQHRRTFRRARCRLARRRFHRGVLRSARQQPVGGCARQDIIRDAPPLVLSQRVAYRRTK